MNVYLKFLAVFFIILSGCGGSDISGSEKVSETQKDISNANVFKVSYSYELEEYEAVGTIRPKTEAKIESQIQAQVKKVFLSPGQNVEKGDVLVVLDNRNAAAKLNQAKEGLKRAKSFELQAKQGVTAAEASYRQAYLNYKRVKGYYEKEASTKQDFEKAESEYIQAKAGLQKAKEVLASAGSQIRDAFEQVSQAEVFFEYTQIKAPDSGEILRKMVEPGDLALPGKPLFIIQTSGMLRVEAYVREGLISSVKKGDEVKVSLKNPEKEFTGIIDEIVPYADPKTRTFLVKALIPLHKDIYPGMYAKILIPFGKKQVLMIPVSCILTKGQLKLVDLKTKDSIQRIYIKTGDVKGNQIEVLSGINAGDEILIQEADDAE